MLLRRCGSLGVEAQKLASKFTTKKMVTPATVRLKLPFITLAFSCLRSMKALWSLQLHLLASLMLVQSTLSTLLLTLNTPSSLQRCLHIQEAFSSTQPLWMGPFYGGWWMMKVNTTAFWPWLWVWPVRFWSICLWCSTTQVYACVAGSLIICLSICLSGEVLTCQPRHLGTLQQPSVKVEVALLLFPELDFLFAASTCCSCCLKSWLEFGFVITVGGSMPHFPSHQLWPVFGPEQAPLCSGSQRSSQWSSCLVNTHLISLQSHLRGQKLK